MGYNLSAVLGFGVKLRSYDANDGLLDSIGEYEHYEDYEDVLDAREEFSIEYAGTDGYTEMFLLVNSTRITADWYGYEVQPKSLLTYIEPLRAFLEDKGIKTKVEDFKWWLLPRWF